MSSFDILVKISRPTGTDLTELQLTFLDIYLRPHDRRRSRRREVYAESTCLGHVWDIPPSALAHVGQVATAAKLLFTLASFSTRQSLLCFYYRIVSDSGMHIFHIALHAANLFNLSVCIAFVFLTIFQCIPVEAYRIHPPTGKCLYEGKVTLAAGVISCFADLLITTLPIPMVLRLQMRLRQRLAVSFLPIAGIV